MEETTTGQTGFTRYQVLTIPEVAEQLRLSTNTIRKFLHEGRLKGIRSGPYAGVWRISQRALDEFMLNDSGSVETTRT
ncbi:MAG: helix-turn-helix domain-containing protein [Ferrimicrobium sp.]